MFDDYLCIIYLSLSAGPIERLYLVFGRSWQASCMIGTVAVLTVCALASWIFWPCWEKHHRGFWKLFSFLGIIVAFGNYSSFWEITIIPPPFYPHWTALEMHEAERWSNVTTNSSLGKRPLDNYFS